MPTKPRYTGFPYPHLCYDSKQCWKENHIPFVGLLHAQYGTKYDVWLCIFKRHLRRKQFLWPDEVRQFVEIFRNKHPEITSNPIREDMHRLSSLGAVFRAGRHASATVFGSDGIFDEPKQMPKPEQREEMFFKLAAKALINLSKKEKK